MPPLAAIVAFSRHAVPGRGHPIGRGGQIPWHFPEDLRHFKATTLGHAIVMGRRTYESVGRPLPARRNLVVSRTLPPAPGVEVFASLEDAVTAARETDAEPFVIGGEGIYRAAMPWVTTLHVTRVDVVVQEADAFFPAIDEEVFERVEARAGGAPELVYETWRRR